MGVGMSDAAEMRTEPHGFASTSPTAGDNPECYHMLFWTLAAR